MSRDSKRVHAELTGVRRERKKKSRREARIRFRASWDLNATKVGIVSTELYQNCVRVAHGVKGIPDVWRYQTGTDKIQEALQEIGIPVDISELDTQKKIKWMLEAFRRVSLPPPPEPDPYIKFAGTMMKHQLQYVNRYFRGPPNNLSHVYATDFGAIEDRVFAELFGVPELKELGGHHGSAEDHVGCNESGGGVQPLGPPVLAD